MAYDCFLQIDGIEGESTDSKHDKWIEVLSYSCGCSMAGDTSSVSRAGGHSSGARVDFQELSCVKSVDASTPNLAQFCCKGAHIPTVTLQLCEATGDKHTYMTYYLEDVLICGVRPGGSSGGGEVRPLEEISFRFARISWGYTPVDNTGKAGSEDKKGWNLGTNEPM